MRNKILGSANAKYHYILPFFYEIHTYIHTYTNTHTHKYIHTYIHIYIYLISRFVISNFTADVDLVLLSLDKRTKIYNTII